MSIAEFAITPNLSVNALPRVPFELYRERSEIVASNEDRDIAELDGNRARLELLRELTRSTSSLPINDVMDQATTAVRKVMRSDFAFLTLLNDQAGPAFVSAGDPAFGPLTQDAIVAFTRQLGERVMSTKTPWTGYLDEAVTSDAACGLESLKWVTVVPLTNRDELRGFLALGKCDDACYTAEEVDFLWQAACQVALAVENAIIKGELGPFGDNGDNETHSKHENGREQVFEGIVGKSSALIRVLRELEVVAPTDSGVLVHGETGTGRN